MEKTSLYLSKVWDTVAKDFDTVQPSTWKIVGKKLVDMSNISQGNYVLDIGSGKGSTLVPISYKIGHNGKVLGIDLSIAMVNFTNKLIAKLNLTNARIFHQDVATITFDDNYFDNIIGSFSFNYILQNKEIFQKVLSKLKTGGTLSFTLWAYDINDIETSNVVGKYIDLPVIPVKQLCESYSQLDTAQDVQNYLELTELRNINVQLSHEGILYANEYDVLKDLYASQFIISVEKIRLLGEDTYNQFEKDLLDMLRTHKVEDGVLITWDVIYATCQR